jgi:16S rRNA processing protein RimM
VAEEAAYLGVARFHKPHGLKGEALIFALTSEPDTVFTEGRELMLLDDAGNPAGAAVTIERARRYHREWLIKFRGVEDRSTLDGWSRQALLGMPKTDLTPPRDDQLYVHEIPGTPVVVGDQVIGVAREIVSGPAGDLLVLEVNGKEMLIPFRKPIVKRVDRAARRIELDPPPGLLDL